MTDTFEILVSGHLCLDLIPRMQHVTVADLTTPGRLYATESVAVSTGGAVSNTGLALHRLGVNVGLMGLVGDDLIGQMILHYLRNRGPTLSDHIMIKSGQASSSTIVLSPANADRTFLHCTGTNEIFGVANIDFELVKKATIFHLGYPSLLPRIIRHDGEELQAIYKEAKEIGVITSLDMAQPDPNGIIAALNWKRIFERTLPSVDIFLPSIEEMVLTLRRSDYNQWMPHVLKHINRTYLYDLAGEFLDMGVAISGFKLGELGMYLRTGGIHALKRLERLGLDVAEWANRELWVPAFKVNVIGTTGAGDAAFAAFLAALLKRATPYEALKWACAVGACSVETADATSGIRNWSETKLRMEGEWAVYDTHLPGYKHGT